MKKIKHTTLLPMAAALIVLAACDSENLSSGESIGSKEAVGEISLTRASANGNVSVDGGYATLTVYAYTGNEESGSAVFHYEKGEWQQANTLLMPEENANFIGVTGTGTPFSFTLPADQSTMSGIFAADLMTTGRTSLGESSSLSLEFCHRLSQVTVNIREYGAEFGGKMPTVSNVSVHSAASVALSYADDGTVAVVSDQPTDVGITPYGSQTDGYKAVIAPKVAGEQLLSLLVNGKLLTANATTDIESGKSYTFNLKVGKDYVALDPVAIGSWEEPVAMTGNTTNIALPEVTDTQAGIFIHYADGDADNADNLKLDAGASQTIEHVWKSSDATPHIVIYSPYVEDAVYDGTVVLTPGTDYRYASINADGSRTVAELLGGGTTLSVGEAYRHVLGRLTLKFKNGDGTDITPDAVALNNFYESGTLSLKSGAVNTSGNRIKENTITEWDDLAVVPQTIPQYGDMVTAVYGGKKYMYTTSEDFVISSGEHVTLTLTIPETSTRSTGSTRRMKGTITIEK